MFDYVVADCPPLPRRGRDRAYRGTFDGFVLRGAARDTAQRETVRLAAAASGPGLMVGVVLNAQRDFFRRG